MPEQSSAEHFVDPCPRCGVKRHALPERTWMGKRVGYRTVWRCMTCKANVSMVMPITNYDLSDKPKYDTGPGSTLSGGKR
jgi:hypothetical protein